MRLCFRCITADSSVYCEAKVQQKFSRIFVFGTPFVCLTLYFGNNFFPLTYSYRAKQSLNIVDINNTHE